MDRNIEQKLSDEAFDRYKETVWCYLKATNALSPNFDPYRKLDTTTTLDAPLDVKAIVHQTSANGLIFKELGLTEVGNIVLVIKDSDVNLLKIASKIIYNDEEYTAYSKAVGNKFQIYKRPFGFSRVILFKKG
jgi:hypothetical protein